MTMAVKYCRLDAFVTLLRSHWKFRGLFMLACRGIFTGNLILLDRCFYVIGDCLKNVKAMIDWEERHNFTQVDQEAVKRPENICAKHKEWRPCNDDKNCNWNMIHYECEMKK